MLGVESTVVADAAVIDRHVLFFSARRFVEALGRTQPTVLVFQDLHWADASLLDLIEVLASRLEDTAVLLLALARPELREDRAGWGSGVHASTALSLEPLGDADARELARCLLADAAGDDSEETATEIGRAAEGNPLFIEELVASVTERSSPDRGELPTSVRGIIAARLDAVPPTGASAISPPNAFRNAPRKIHCRPSEITPSANKGSVLCFEETSSKIHSISSANSCWNAGG